MLYVITAVHNRFDITNKFINQLNNQTYKDFRLIIVDDGSTDGTAGMIVRESPSAIVISGDGNLWWGGALNEAYKWIKENASQMDYVLIANDDSSFDENYLEKGTMILQKEPGILLTGCGYSVNTGRQLDGVRHWNFKIGGCTDLIVPNDEGNCASTRSLFMRVSTMLQIGGFHPVLLPHYASDFEWTIRAAKKGIKIKSYDTLSYYFDEGTTGDNNLNTASLKKIFSKRSNLNPIYRASFILMSTPVKYLPGHLLYQMLRYLKKIPRIIERRNPKQYQGDGEK